MSISSISASSASYVPTQQDSQRQNLLALTKAIDSGDLSGAQQAYRTLTDSQNGTQPDPNSPLGQALAQIGKDLQSGDIGAAQKDLSSLRSKAHGHRHHHHHAEAAETSAPAQSTTPTASSSTTNILDIKA